MAKNMKTILKTLVGSRAHGLNREDSDFDWRGVFIEPTSEILKLNSSARDTSWVEGKEDDTQYELGRFLYLATKCNPAILEVMCSPVKEDETTELGMELRSLFPVIWEPKRVMDAFMGYSKNQEKKFMDRHDDRVQKYSVEDVRALWQCKVLLETGELKILVDDEELRKKLLKWKNAKEVTPEMVGEVTTMASHYRNLVEGAYDRFPDKDKKCDMESVNSFLLKVRKDNW